MKSLKIGISGVRGIVGETFTPELVCGFAQAFGTYMDGGRILVCRDPRPSGPMVAAAVFSGLLASGCEIIDLGICPTPSLQLAVRQMKAQGGISITAGHNPTHWNALKFVRSDGLYFNASQAEELLDIFHQGEFNKAGWRELNTSIPKADALELHLAALQAAFDVEQIRSRKLRVAVDCCNGSCSILSPRWLGLLGCQVLAVNDDPSLPFPHHPEPRRETLAQLRAIVKAGQADIGFAHDADGERLGIVTETGESLVEEMTLAMAVQIKLAQKPGPVVTNISTSQAIELIAQQTRSPVIRTPVGQAYISEAMIEHQGVIGGEGSGGVIVPEIQMTHDSAAALALILEWLARTGSRISELARTLPQLAIVKHNIAVPPNRIYALLQDFLEQVEKEKPAKIELLDGIKINWPNGWLHTRASNTESMIRIIAEAATPAEAQQLLNWARDRLS
jgi:phosphomannomutase